MTRGRILLMDDEEIVRLVTAGMLTELGYEVVTTQSGEEALDVYKQAYSTGHSFSAVILDLTIRQGMGGKDAICLLRDLDPHVRGIVFSGFSDDPAVSDYKGHGFSGFIIKPCNIDELKEAIEGVLSQS